MPTLIEATPSTESSTKTCRIILLGAGTVGGELARIIAELADLSDASPRFEVVQALVRESGKARVGIPSERLVDDPNELRFDDADLVIEALGGPEPARTLTLCALNAGIPVITANKTLIATHGDELLAAAERNNVALRFEAAVGAATPCVRVLRETLRGVTVNRIFGVLNGTSHYVLNSVTRHGRSLLEAVALAQKAGFAEADPSADLDGHDAAQKLAILCWCASGSLLDPTAIQRVELPALSQETVLAAGLVGFAVKPLASLSWNEDGEAESWIAPAAVPGDTPLAATGGVDAAVVIQTKRAGTIFLSAQGAGAGPTASALFDDLEEVAQHREFEAPAGNPARIELGGADLPREWVIHAPAEAELTVPGVVEHIVEHGGEVRQFRTIDLGGWVVHVAGIRYSPRFTEPLVEQGACVLEVVR